jgi:hypothetical protein
MPIITDSGKIRCPQCHKEQDVLAYVRLKNLAPNESVDIIKCRLCRHIFAPIDPYSEIFQ